MRRKSIYIILYCCFMACLPYLNAQPGSTIEIKKPQKYETRKLGSEKTAETGFAAPKHIYQNMVTHYNYYYNANNRLNDLIERAKQVHQDTFSNRLISFYNYSLENTATEKNELDTIIYKCTAGILLHDLRSDWVDNMYMLLGKAYYLRKDIDSSINVFRYINYAFAPKDEGYDIPIGSNESNKKGLFSVVTDEQRNAWQKMTTHLPSRNEALLWLARDYVQTGEYYKASGLLELLRTDPKFPERLQTTLNEMFAFLYYNEKYYDSAAVSLTKALDNAVNKQERARWEYLIAQLYEQAGNKEKAAEYYTISANRTYDPVMEVYATLNMIRVSGNDDESFLQQKLDKLLQLARKDKFILNRDIIYYAAAKVALQMGKMDDAEKYLLKSVSYNNQINPGQKSVSYLLLGDMSYDLKKYLKAHNYYDSVDASRLTNAEDKNRLLKRKPSLKSIASNVQTVEKQDSLQHLASLSEDELDKIVKKVLKKLEKEEDQKRQTALAATQSSNFPIDNMRVPGMTAGTSTSENWYFNNFALKSNGYTQFKTQWGNRANVDNWRLSSVVEQSARANVEEAQEESHLNERDSAAALEDTTMSYEALMNRIPLTSEKMALSHEQIINSLFDNAMIFQNKLEDYPTAIETYLEILRRYPDYKDKEQLLFNLYYCYRRLGNEAGADSMALALKSGYPGGQFTKLIGQKIVADNSEKNPATQVYQDVYDLFIEGSFEEAKDKKRKADSIFGKTYWSPQLLYIESVYYIKQREDSTAIGKLTDLKNMYASSPLAEKAQTMIDVLRRRKEIEDYLTKLNIKRYEDDEDIPYQEPAKIARVERIDLDSLAKANAKPQEIIVMDADNKPLRINANELKVISQGQKPGGGKDSLLNVVINGKPTLIKVDDYGKPVIIDESQLVTVGQKQPSGTKIDSIAGIAGLPTRGLNVDTAAVKRPVVQKLEQFLYNSEEPQYVALIMDKVDPVYLSEAQNAFNRFNRERYYNDKINVSLYKLDDRYHILLMGPMKDAAAALDYINKNKPLVSTRIIAWLDAKKYTYCIISESNLTLLKENKDINGYRNLLKQVLPEYAW